MQAVVLRDYGGFDRLRLEETETPTVGAGEILIRNCSHRRQPLRYGRAPRRLRRRPDLSRTSWGSIPPERSRRSGRASPDSRSETGSHPHFLLSCGTCRNCIAGKDNICLKAGVLGVTTWGTYAQFVKVKPTMP